MTEIGVVVAVGMLVAFALLKGYATKALGQLHHECSSLMLEERRLQQERGQEEILIESAEARRNQVEYEIQKYTGELEDLASQVKKLEGELRRPGEEEV